MSPKLYARAVIVLICGVIRVHGQESWAAQQFTRGPSSTYCGQVGYTWVQYPPPHPTTTVLDVNNTSRSSTTAESATTVDVRLNQIIETLDSLGSPQLHSEQSPFMLQVQGSPGIGERVEDPDGTISAELSSISCLLSNWIDELQKQNAKASVRIDALTLEVSKLRAAASQSKERHQIALPPTLDELRRDGWVILFGPAIVIAAVTGAVWWGLWLLRRLIAAAGVRLNIFSTSPTALVANVSWDAFVRMRSW